MNNKYRKKTFYKTLSFSLGISMLLSGAFSGSASAGSLPGSSEKAQNSGNPESPKASLENAGQAPSAPPLSEAEAIHIADVEDLFPLQNVAPWIPGRKIRFLCWITIWI